MCSITIYSYHICCEHKFPLELSIVFNYFTFHHLWHALLVSSSLLFPEKSILCTKSSILSFLVSKTLFGIQILIPRRRSWSICWPVFLSVLKEYFLGCCTLPVIYDYCTFLGFFLHFTKIIRGAQWSSGKVFDSRTRTSGIKSQKMHWDAFMSKTCYPLLCTISTQEDPYQHD